VQWSRIATACQQGLLELLPLLQPSPHHHPQHRHLQLGRHLCQTTHQTTSAASRYVSLWGREVRMVIIHCNQAACALPGSAQKDISPLCASHGLSEAATAWKCRRDGSTQLPSINIPATHPCRLQDYDMADPDSWCVGQCLRQLRRAGPTKCAASRSSTEQPATSLHSVTHTS
jgi:hypothetical protein